MDLKQRIAADLDEARHRTHELLAPVDDERLTTQYDMLMSPPVWDYAHIGVFEELWLVQRISDTPPIDEELLHTYNAIETPRVVRGRRQLLDRASAAAYLVEVRRRTLALLEEIEFEDDDPLLRDGFVYDLIVQHEHQHDETILQTLQLTPGLYRELLPALPDGRMVEPDMVCVPAGRYTIGTDSHEPYDNEHPCHEAELAGFRIDRFPVSNGDYVRFIAGSGSPSSASRLPSTGRAHTGDGAPGALATFSRSTLACRSARSPGSRLRRTLAGRVSASRRSSSGRWPRRGIRRRPGAAGTRGATTHRLRSWPTWINGCSRRRRSALIRAAPARWAASRCWAISGSGPAAISSPTRGSRCSHTPNIRSRSSALGSRCCAAGRGRRDRAWPATRFATGTRD